MKPDKPESPTINYRFQDLVVFEDEHLFALNKPAFLSSLNERQADKISLQSIIQKQSGHLQLCHRIDKETSGLILVSKNESVYRDIALLFQERKIKKTYHTMVQGKFFDSVQEVNLPISQDKKGKAFIDKKDGKASTTIFERIKLFKHYSLLACQPLSGRFHQIRIHLASMHFPICGDELYSGKKVFLSDFKKQVKIGRFEEEKALISRCALHAFQLEFNFNDKDYSITSNYPKDMEATLKILDKWDSLS